ncbi:MAG: hypothetical protein U0359_30940 [Byssovorax sp.]
MTALVPRAARALGAVPAPPLAPLFAPADALRARLLRALAPVSPIARALVVDRQRRVVLVGSMLLVSAYLGASTLPLWFLAIGPIVWGIPHILSDTRYMVARPGLHRRPLVMLILAAGVVAAGAGAGLRGALGAAMLVLLVARASPLRKAIGITFLAGCFALTQWAGWTAEVVFGHLHNLIAVALWWAWRKRSGHWHLLPLALFTLGTILLLGGAADPILARTGGLHSPWTGLTINHLADTLSPTYDPVWSMRLVVYYAFAQSAHYVVWMRLIPEEDRPSATPRSFAQSYRALRADLGSLILWGALLSAMALAVWAFLRVGEARDGYIRLAFFHGYIEVIAGALLFAEGALPLGGGARRQAATPS